MPLDVKTWVASAVLVAVSACGGGGGEATSTEDSPLDASAAATPLSKDEERFRLIRERMVETQIERRDLGDPLVMAAMRTVPRHIFVPGPYQSRAYADTPLPIGYGQTISQPYIVALMTALLEVEPGDRILEVGTGSGYQAAVLAEIGAEVYSIEIIPELAEEARPRLEFLGYANVETRVGDGYFGWEEHAPFDGIIVTAAPDHVPPALLRQLRPSGRMIVPVGPQGSMQTLWLIRQRDGEWVSFNQGPVLFVPLVGGD